MTVRSANDERRTTNDESPPRPAGRGGDSSFVVRRSSFTCSVAAGKTFRKISGLPPRGTAGFRGNVEGRATAHGRDARNAVTIVLRFGEASKGTFRVVVR